MRIDDRIEDLMFLLDHRVDLEVALARVDWTASAASRALYRRGMTRLARDTHLLIPRDRSTACHPQFAPGD